MRILLILRGNYHCGQEEWIEKYSLKDYTIDLNHLRFLSSKTKKLANHYEIFEFHNDIKLIPILLNFLEFRMEKGEFCILNTYEISYKFYKKLAKKYFYKVFFIDFTNLDLEECYKRSVKYATNHKILIPKEILKKTHLFLQKIPKKYPILKPDEWKQCLYKITNLNSYKKIHHIGDIQGCYSVLKKYLKKIKKDEFYIFLGDYINRGIENSKVMKLLLKLYYLPNVCLLEGNHERNLIKWANNENIYSKEFNNFTLKDFYKEKITQKDAKKIYSYLKECFWYEYYDKKVFCCHGGINFLPKEEKLSLISSDNFINGIGTYDESQIIADEFKKNTPKNYYQIFGHRNRFKLPIRLNSKVFLCEAKVDKGGFLRIVTLDRQGFDCIELKNKIYKKNSYNFPKNN